MGTQIVLTSPNYSSYIADITFYAQTGGTISLGSHLTPYTADLDYFYGTYQLCYSAFGFCCETTIVAPTPTPSPTPNPACPQQLDFYYTGQTSEYSAFTGTYQRTYTYTGGTMVGGYMNINTISGLYNFVAGADPSGKLTAIYTRVSGSTYYTIIPFAIDGGNIVAYAIYQTNTDYIFNGQQPLPFAIGLDSILVSPNIGGLYYPRQGDNDPTNEELKLITYPVICPTATPTQTTTPTTTPTNTATPSVTPSVTTSVTPSVTPTKTQTPTPTSTPSYRLYTVQAFTQSGGSCSPGGTLSVKSTATLVVGRYYCTGVGCNDRYKIISFNGTGNPAYPVFEPISGDVGNANCTFLICCP